MSVNGIRTYSIPVISGLAFFAISFITGSTLNVFTVDSYVYNTAIAMVALIASISIIQILVFSRFRVISFYLGLLQTVTFFVFALISFPGILFPLFLVAFLLESMSVVLISKEIERRKLRVVVALISLTIMIYFGNLLQFAFNRPDTGIVVASTESVFVALGQYIPFLEINGLFIFSRHFDLILSFQQYVMFMALTILISENYFQIISLVSEHGRKGGRSSLVVYGLTGALSCQCESYISFLPALSILLINYILFPVIIFSILLLSATYIIISRIYRKGKSMKYFSSSFYSNRKFLIIAVSFIILMGTPLFITVVVYMSLLSSALFFFLTGMIMILDGYVIVALFSMIFEFRFLKQSAGIVLAGVGTFATLIWFYPPLTHLAFKFPPYFVLMNTSMLVSGILYGIAHSILETRWKDVLTEYISTVYGIFSLVIFYVIVTFQVSIWPFFSLNSQIQFSLLTWTIMLPIMWITTQISLNRISRLELHV